MRLAVVILLLTTASARADDETFDDRWTEVNDIRVVRVIPIMPMAPDAPAAQQFDIDQFNADVKRAHRRQHWHSYRRRRR